MKYRIGLDIGIGSIGWAVINEDEPRIEDFGVRIFDSGELNQGKDRKSQERRGFRGVRRLERRRRYRKTVLKNYLFKIGFLGRTFEDDYAAVKDADVHTLKVKGLDEKLSPAELFKCLIHTCNHRGYRDFYEDDANLDEEDESGVNKKAARAFDAEYLQSGYRTVSEYLLCNAAQQDSARPIEFRNIAARKEANFRLIHRSLLKDEVNMILEKQREYYSCLNDSACRFIVDGVVFSQRDFETGPGREDDSTRRYKGFLASLGKCPFKKDDVRGFRSTVIADLYAVTNTLSQYKYIDTATGEVALRKDIAQEIVNWTLANGNITVANVKTILKARGFILQKSENSDDKALSKAVKFIKAAKSVIDESGLSWDEFISEDQFDVTKQSRLHRIGEVVAKFQTPARRKNELVGLAFLNKEAVKAFSALKIGGTAGAGYAYMCEAIQAFCEGDIYGNYQANFFKEAAETEMERHIKLSAADIADEDVSNNPVVIRSINEARKIVNAIIDVYGSPSHINIEVASDLNRSFEMRDKIRKQQAENEKENEKAREKVSELLGIRKEEVRSESVERYKLYEQQGGVCLYSGEPLGDPKDVLDDRNRICEVDHIVPFSLILDNSLHNKALVLARENQTKGQRTPLMYLTGDKRASFIARVNAMFSKKNAVISKRKYEYLTLTSVYDTEKLTEWKSRNINDTRYITKYIMGIFRNKLVFADNSGTNVFAVKGALTSRFRRVWLRTLKWGTKNKDELRDTYLNHAVDAVVIANLTSAFIEVASENMQLYSIWKHHGKKTSEEYEDYLARSVERLHKIWHFRESYAENLLRSINRVPSYIPDLSTEVAVRFDSTTVEELREKCEFFYRGKSDFVVPPHLPMASLKQKKCFSGAIADSNPVKLMEEGGKVYKVKRKEISKITPQDLEYIRTNDTAMLRRLHEILDGKEKTFTVGKYMAEQNMPRFTLETGRMIYKASVRDKGTYSNYFRKEISDGNYSNLGMLKYYCVEVYRDVDNKTRLRGVRFVDIVRKDKKLYVKKESLPADYRLHVMYLFKNEYIEIVKLNGTVKYAGFYQSVYNIQQSKLCMKATNEAKSIVASIAENDTFVKYDISVLGQKGGVVRCSEPLSLIRASE